MVIDKIENYKLYVGLSDKIAKAFEYIVNTDLFQTKVGKYEIDSDNIFVLVQEYDTKDKSTSKHEAHHKYIDVQYIVSGVELIGVKTLTNQGPVIVDKENDYDLYELDSDFIKLDAGMFAIFFPDDLHMPCIKVDKISKVKKVVVKVKI